MGKKYKYYKTNTGKYLNKYHDDCDSHGSMSLNTARKEYKTTLIQQKLTEKSKKKDLYQDSLVQRRELLENIVTPT